MPAMAVSCPGCPSHPLRQGSGAVADESGVVVELVVSGDADECSGCVCHYPVTLLRSDPLPNEAAANVAP